MTEKVMFRFCWNSNPEYYANGYSNWYELTNYIAENIDDYKKLYESLFHKVWIEYQ